MDHYITPGQEKQWEQLKYLQEKKRVDNGLKQLLQLEYFDESTNPVKQNLSQTSKSDHPHQNTLSSRRAICKPPISTKAAQTKFFFSGGDAGNGNSPVNINNMTMKTQTARHSRQCSLDGNKLNRKQQLSAAMLASIEELKQKKSVDNLYVKMGLNNKASQIELIQKVQKKALSNINRSFNKENNSNNNSNIEDRQPLFFGKPQQISKQIVADQQLLVKQRQQQFMELLKQQKDLQMKQQQQQKQIPEQIGNISEFQQDLSEISWTGSKLNAARIEYEDQELECEVNQDLKVLHSNSDDEECDNGNEDTINRSGQHFSLNFTLSDAKSPITTFAYKYQSKNQSSNKQQQQFLQSPQSISLNYHQQRQIYHQQQLQYQQKTEQKIMLETHSAIKIQSNFRRLLCQRIFNKQRLAAVIIQRAVRVQQKRCQERIRQYLLSIRVQQSRAKQELDKLTEIEKEYERMFVTGANNVAAGLLQQEQTRFKQILGEYCYGRVLEKNQIENNKLNGMLNVSQLQQQQQQVLNINSLNTYYGSQASSNFSKDTFRNEMQPSGESKISHDGCVNQNNSIYTMRSSNNQGQTNMNQRDNKRMNTQEDQEQQYGHNLEDYLTTNVSERQSNRGQYQYEQKQFNQYNNQSRQCACNNNAKLIMNSLAEQLKQSIQSENVANNQLIALTQQFNILNVQHKTLIANLSAELNELQLSIVQNSTVEQISDKDIQILNFIHSIAAQLKEPIVYQSPPQQQKKNIGNSQVKKRASSNSSMSTGEAKFMRVSERPFEQRKLVFDVAPGYSYLS